MRFLRVLLLDILLLALLIAGLIALWGLRGTTSQEDVPVTIRVTKGQVAIIDPRTEDEERGGGLQTLRIGQRVRVDAGSDAFLFYPNGSISRITGPGELVLEQSQRTVRKPPILTRVRSKLFGSDPPPPGEVKLVVRARLLSGSAVTRAAAPASSGSVFEVTGPGVIVAPSAASFALTIPERGEVAIEVGQGQVAVGIVSITDGAAIPIVVPQLVSRTGISVPLLAPEKAASPKVRGLAERVALALPDLAGRSGPVSAQGIDFRDVTNAEIRHFVGERVDGRPVVAAAIAPARRTVNTTGIEEAVRVPGTESTVITDKMVADATPTGLPGSPKVHFLPGGVVQVDYGGLTFVASLNVVNGRVEIRGLPVSIDPPQIEDAIKKTLGLQELPAVLSIVSQDGQAAITYAKDTVVTSRVDAISGEEEPVPDSLPHNATYFKSIPTPRELSTDWEVVGSNALIAAVITLLALTFAGFATSLVREQEERIARLYAPVVRMAKTIQRWAAPLVKVLGWLKPGPVTRGVLMMFVFGAVYSFLALGKGLFGPGGLAVLLTLSFTSGFLALYDPWVRAFFARRMRIAARVGLNPGQLGVSMLTVGVSRAFAFKPGLMLGLPGGLKLPAGALTDRQKFTLNIASLLFLVLLGALAWALVYLLPQIAVQSWAQGFFKTARGFVSGVQDWSLVIFAIVVQRLLFGLLPLPGSAGQDLMKRTLIGWIIPFALAAFVFVHTQLNRTQPIQDLTPKMYTTVIVAVALGSLALAYRRYQGRKRAAAA